MDYTIFYKSSYDYGKISMDLAYDLFFSSYDSSERTKVIFEKVNSKEKIWIKFPHYELAKPPFDVYECTSYKEDECFIDLFGGLDISTSTRICIDITGFIRPHLIFLINLLHRSGIKKIDFLYTEPVHYLKAEETKFSGFIDEVKIIEGCSSEVMIPNTENDILIITAGYDDKLFAAISKVKSKIKRKYYILGFPSLQPDMYQESILKMFQAKDSIGQIKSKYAPAFDPFVTAQVINEIIEENPENSNIYLSPLSTKPQTLGVALFYLWNYKRLPINILFPYSNKYFPKTAEGIKRTWKYTFELP